MESNLPGTRLAHARRDLGITQEELGNRLGVARTTVAEIEAGKRKLTAQELYRLCEILCRPMGYFFSPGEPETVYALRLDAEELSEPVRQALVELDNRLADIRRLEAFSGVRLHSRLGQYRLSDWRSVDSAAQHIARAERTRLGVGTGPISNLREALEERIGLLAFGHYVPSGKFSGAFASDGQRGALLFNVAHLRGRINFTLAHEYGHSLVAESGAHVELRGQKETAQERFAQRFAANFLMTLQALEEAVERFGIRPPGLSEDEALALASHFDVSFAALLGRLEHFSIITHEVADRLRKAVKPVARARELSLPDPREAFPALPVTYQQMAFVAFHRGAISRSRLAELLEADVDDAHSMYTAWAVATLKTSDERREMGVAAH